MLKEFFFLRSPNYILRVSLRGEIKGDDTAGNVITILKFNRITTLEIGITIIN